METAGWVDTAAEGENFLRAHPGLQGAAEASHQMQDPQHSAATQQSAATVRELLYVYLAFEITRLYMLSSIVN